MLCVRKVTLKSYQLLSHPPNRRTCLCCCRCCFWCRCGCRCGCHCRCWCVWENRQWEISFYHILPTVALKPRPQITDNCDPRRKHNRMVCSICLTRQCNNSTCCLKPKLNLIKTLFGPGCFGPNCKKSIFEVIYQSCVAQLVLKGKKIMK